MTQSNDYFSQLEKLWDQPALCRVWPPGEEVLPLPLAVRLAGHDRLGEGLDHALRSAAAQQKLLHHPIIAVLGELNAGKSSVVASFLSAQGRQRLPRGLGDSEGTHRFVYWVPSSWLRDASLKQALLDLLAAAHGDQCEYLSPNPEQAAQQYRSGKDNVAQLRCPLLADDPALDDLGAAFLDCPDVQTKDIVESADATATANPRLEFVGDAARICSAFLLVWEAGKVRDQLFATFLASIRERMATVPICLLINKIEPNRGEPAQTRNTASLAQAMERFGIADDGCYGAFHFRMKADGEPGNPGYSPGWNDLTPPALVARHQQDNRQFPQFFALSSQDAANAPQDMDERRFLIHLPRKLTAARLQRQKVADSAREMHRLLGQAGSEIRAYISRQQQQADTIHAGLLNLCASNFTDGATGQPLQVPTHEFTAALKESFVRTSPGWVRWSMKISHPFERAVKATQARLQKINAAMQLKVRAGLSQQIKEQLADMGLEGVGSYNAEQLSRTMRAQRWTPISVDEECLNRGWSAVLNGFRQFPLEQDPARLDVMTADFWRHVSVWQKVRVAGMGVLAALGTVTAFAGLMVAVVDMGAASLPTFSLMTALSAKLPGAAALAAAAVGGAGAFAGFAKGAIELNTLPYLSKFFALACDAFGTPRKSGGRPLQVRFGKRGESVFLLPDAGIPPQPAVCPLADLRQWREGEALQQLEDSPPHAD
ncbi:MAG: hypothetical protein AB7O62_16795 [Pirellulales bacterium]